MEHHTDRILWTVLILAIGVTLYVGFRPAANGLLHQGIDKTQAVMTNVNSNPSDSSSDSSGTVDSDDNSDFTYSAPNTADNTISITGYTGKSANLTIPTYRKIGSVEYKVTSIDDLVFDNNTALTSVDIPDSVTSIGSYAFYKDSNLKQLTLGSGVTVIFSHAFYGTALTRVDFPASLKVIDSAAFAMTPLSDISFKSPVTLSGSVFRNNKLTNVTLPMGSRQIDPKDPNFDSNVTVTVK